MGWRRARRRRWSRIWCRRPRRGTAYGGYAAAIGLATLPASVLAGILWEGLFAWQGFGPAAPFVFGAGMAGVAAVLLLVTVPGGRVSSTD